MTVDDALLYVDELVRLANDPRYAPSPLLPQMMALAAEVRRYRKMRCDWCKHGSETLTQILEELRAINRNVDRIRLHMGVGL